MANKTQHIDEHVGELLSGYLDGELTQQERQRVEIHLDACTECKTSLDELRALRESIGKARLSAVGQDVWREMMDEPVVRTTRSIGWLLLIGGILIVMGFGLFAFVFDSSLSLVEKLVAGAIYGGLALLFYSALRQRLRERKTDKYKDVEI
jgi:putative zinc finger protein